MYQKHLCENRWKYKYLTRRDWRCPSIALGQLPHTAYCEMTACVHLKWDEIFISWGWIYNHNLRVIGETLIPSHILRVSYTMNMENNTEQQQPHKTSWIGKLKRKVNNNEDVKTNEDDIHKEPRTERSYLYIYINGG